MAILRTEDPRKNGASTASRQKAANKTDTAKGKGSGGASTVNGYTPSQDYGDIAAKRVNGAAQGQFNTNSEARVRAIREWQAANGNLGTQKDASIAGARENNTQMRDRLNNTMASRGISNGGDAALNFANINAKAAGVITGIEGDYLNKYGQMQSQKDERIQALNDADAALKAQLPSKIDELRAALEGQDFSRWSTMQGLQLQAQNMQNQKEQAAAAIQAQKDATAAQQDFYTSQQRDAYTKETAATIYKLGQSGKADYGAIAAYAASRGVTDMSQFYSILPESILPARGRTGNGLRSLGGVGGGMPYAGSDAYIYGPGATVRNGQIYDGTGRPVGMDPNAGGAGWLRALTEPALYSWTHDNWTPPIWDWAMGNTRKP